MPTMDNPRSDCQEEENGYEFDDAKRTERTCHANLTTKRPENITHANAPYTLSVHAARTIDAYT
jgi:hypothetical protein